MKEIHWTWFVTILIPALYQVQSGSVLRETRSVIVGTLKS